MKRPRGSALIVALIVSAALATPVIAHMASGGSDGDLILGRWDHAAVLFGEDGDSATVIMVYDAGDRDPARRIEVEQQEAPGVDLTVAVLLEPADDTLIDPVRRPVCIKASIRGLRSSAAPDMRLTDRNNRKVEGQEPPRAGFVLPPLSDCRTVEAEVVGD